MDLIKEIEGSFQLITILMIYRHLRKKIFALKKAKDTTKYWKIMKLFVAIMLLIKQGNKVLLEITKMKMFKKIKW